MEATHRTCETHGMTDILVEGTRGCVCVCACMCTHAYLNAFSVAQVLINNVLCSVLSQQSHSRGGGGGGGAGRKASQRVKVIDVPTYEVNELYTVSF